MRIYLLQSEKTAERSWLNNQQSLNGIQHIQWNHKVQNRSLPNDTLFNIQWALFNDGSTGGMAGADINADSAWNISTGGITIYGDTIVVAVIDAGFHLNHPDLKENIFLNRNEIAGNGIDDDNNGYIDDINGWNVYMNGPNHPSDKHGTHVSGIIGAKGNNEIGISGINWDVKILPVSGSSGIESEVISSYEYILSMRRLYNETNGEKGAYIVSTNASFGVDGADPSDYPIWCSIYDSLGKEGIINIGATSNLNVDVTTAGDVPTTCSSPYLIGVTSTNKNDVLAGTAYSKDHIDLAAPGHQIISTVFDSAYTQLTGTSMASPHVAGAVGLMYASACGEIISLSHHQSDSAARLMRFLLLDAVDTISNLTNKTVSGGRLNLFKSVKRSTCQYLNQPKHGLANAIKPKILFHPYTNQYSINWEKGIKQINIFNTQGQLIIRKRLINSKETTYFSLPQKGIIIIQVLDEENRLWYFKKNNF